MVPAHTVKLLIGGVWAPGTCLQPEREAETVHSCGRGGGGVRRLKELEFGHSENREECRLGSESGDDGLWQVDGEQFSEDSEPLCHSENEAVTVGCFKN